LNEKAETKALFDFKSYNFKIRLTGGIDFKEFDTEVKAEEIISSSDG